MNIYSVIVSFNPDTSILYALCRALIKQGSNVTVIDNTENNFIEELGSFHNCTLILLGENTGIAHAQNVGIEFARQQKANVIIFFDQDSTIPDNFISKLLEPLEIGKPGVVSPVFFDINKGFKFPAMKLGRFGMLKKIFSAGTTAPYEVDVVISSGLAFTPETLDLVGLMDEDFFIDFVDTDWCLRCRYKGVPIRVVPTAIMGHSLGDSSVKLGFMRGFVYSPIRSYYQIRNSFLFMRKKHVSLMLGMREVLSLWLHHLILFVLQKNKKVYFKMYCLAIWHGIKGISAKKPI
jgi:rhamnosyltransferase